jgi:hypothetical protein
MRLITVRYLHLYILYRCYEIDHWSLLTRELLIIWVKFCIFYYWTCTAHALNNQMSHQNLQSTSSEEKGKHTKIPSCGFKKLAFLLNKQFSETWCIFGFCHIGSSFLSLPLTASNVFNCLVHAVWLTEVSCIVLSQHVHKSFTKIYGGEGWKEVHILFSDFFSTK